MRSEDRVARPGSSPLTRGKRGGGDPGVASGRLIPAHAGKTSMLRVTRCTGGAHPRSRGENENADDVVRCCHGSSPLTRGKPASIMSRLASERLIPAHAGKTCYLWGCHRNPEAHPRSRGENQYAEGDTLHWRGSSPLTRGKRERGRCGTLLPRLIPAHAGKTLFTAGACVFSQAHPRSRGENFQMGTPRSASWGSSPLTRGKPRRRPQEHVHWRLIPAHAGKT